MQKNKGQTVSTQPVGPFFVFRASHIIVVSLSCRMHCWLCVHRVRQKFKESFSFFSLSFFLFFFLLSGSNLHICARALAGLFDTDTGVERRGKGEEKKRRALSGAHFLVCNRRCCLVQMCFDHKFGRNCIDHLNIAQTKSQREKKKY